MLLGFGAVFEGINFSSASRQIGPLVDSDLWAFPSRLYSRPLVVQAGMSIHRAALAARLERLGYAETSNIPCRSREFRLFPAGLEVFTGSFGSPDGEVAAQPARLTFREDNIVATICDYSGSTLARLAFEPELLATLSGDNAEERTVLALSEFPERLIQAVITTEDRRFFRHHGIDPVGVLRATWVNLRQGAIVQGGSTITQQTVKNVFLGSERTWARKLAEAHMALALEALHPKERILEIYLNEVYLGQREGVAVCGFGEASRHYWGKEPRDLDLAESALLAGLIRSPGSTNPFRYLARAVERRDMVLAAMRSQGQISEREYRAAVAEKPILNPGCGRFRGAPFLVQFVRKELRQRYSMQTITHGGLRIYTTLDTHLQGLAERAVQDGLADLERKPPRLKERGRASIEAAMVVLDPQNGEILALVGGRDFSRNQFDHASLARRQPGSLFKPLVYLAGFEQAAYDPSFAFTPASLLRDSPIDVPVASGVWAPQNYDVKFRGWVTVRRALEQSINVPAVRASQYIGVDAVAEVARKFGIALHDPVYPSLALGAVQVTPVDMARAYAVIANGGYAVDPIAMLGVTERNGRVLECAVPRPQQVASATSAYLTLDLMRGVIDRGTGQRARAAGIRGDIAGKTGTTNDKRDAWFIGFTPDLLVAVWVGFDDNSPTGLTGAQAALPIWIDFMLARGGADASSSFQEPSGITRAWIDPYTGGLATEYCPQVLQEVFQVGTETYEPCVVHANPDRLAQAVSTPQVDLRQLGSWHAFPLEALTPIEARRSKQVSPRRRKRLNGHEPVRGSAPIHPVASGRE